MHKLYFTLFFLLFFQLSGFGQKIKSDANIVGYVGSPEGYIPFATVLVKGTTIGTVTDETGKYELRNIPEGELTVVVQMVGYKPEEYAICAEANETMEIEFELERDVLQMEEVVVSADRSAQKRSDAPVIVNTISPKLFSSSQSVVLGDGLNFSPGLRLENNCQNCGFTQVRMNGMEGPYSQILINSRPIFSGLAGVYGLELLPVNMIEKVEVIRGGGSALFGSNAIAGTINIILKDPFTNAYEAGVTYSLTGIGSGADAIAVPDHTLNFNTSLVSNDQKWGITFFGFKRNRAMFDANGDDFSEIAPLTNLSLGSRIFHRFGHRSKLILDFFTINEQRDGGNMQEYPLHERDVAEAVTHELKTGAITWEQYFREYDLFSVYVSGQFLDRDSYYGANQSLSDYGNSEDRTCHAGLQYKAVFGSTSLILGTENTGSYLLDKKLGYPDYAHAEINNDSIGEIPHTNNTVVSNQSLYTSGVFSQFEIKLNKIKIALGARYDHYEVKDLAKEITESKTGDVFSPRISLMFNVLKDWKARLSYSQGYRAPQIFDEDLHIETSGSRQVININDPGLKQETSHSIMASLDFNGLIGTMNTGLLLEGFYTRLSDPFVNVIGEPDEKGTVIYTRMNAVAGAKVRGLNLEFKLIPVKHFSLVSGFTVQSSVYDVAREFEEKRFFRTPNQYGYFVMDWDFTQQLCLSATGNYTGRMLVPYYGTENPEGELRESENFFDAGIRLKYTMEINGTGLQCFGGMRNVFNSYQSDFDLGQDRDPSYMYGPVSPRSVYVGLRIGNFVK